MRILQISTHTTIRPRHGGQLRSHHIGRMLASAGFEIKRLAVACRSVEDPVDPDEPLIDISRSPIYQQHVGGAPFEFHDLCGLRAVLEDHSLFSRFESAVSGTDPDVVMLEHPWMWPALIRTSWFARTRARVIYNSQNVETHLKRRMLATAPGVENSALLHDVERLERDLVRSCTATTACTPSDGDVFAGWGARRVVIAGNGATSPMREHLIGSVPAPLTRHHRYALFVGSSHLPNLAGLQQFIAPALPMLRPLHRIVLAGLVGPHFASWLGERHLSRLVKDRLVVMGQVGETCLDSLIANASVILLPIPYGGGSNVKTAEALLSGRPIVATPEAMRGFDEFRDVPGLALADDAGRFQGALMAALESDEAPCRDRGLFSSLLWQNTLAPIVDLLREMESET
ncbi:MAG: glycosyltransferase [Xanthobacteraceae bacterium]|nr:glycosyltransferase [Xanthobacteraceae bacterium]